MAVRRGAHQPLPMATPCTSLGSPLVSHDLLPHIAGFLQPADLCALETVSRTVHDACGNDAWAAVHASFFTLRLPAAALPAAFPNAKRKLVHRYHERLFALDTNAREADSEARKAEFSSSQYRRRRLYITLQAFHYLAMILAPPLAFFALWFSVAVLDDPATSYTPAALLAIGVLAVCAVSGAVEVIASWKSRQAERRNAFSSPWLLVNTRLFGPYPSFLKNLFVIVLQGSTLSETAAAVAGLGVCATPLFLWYRVASPESMSWRLALAPVYVFPLFSAAVVACSTALDRSKRRRILSISVGPALCFVVGIFLVAGTLDGDFDMSFVEAAIPLMLAACCMPSLFVFSEVLKPTHRVRRVLCFGCLLVITPVALPSVASIAMIAAKLDNSDLGYSFATAASPVMGILFCLTALLSLCSCCALRRTCRMRTNPSLPSTYLGRNSAVTARIERQRLLQRIPMGEPPV